MSHYQTRMQTPIGQLIIQATDCGVSYVGFEDKTKQFFAETDTYPPYLSQAVHQLHEYFAGTRQTFDLMLAAEGTDFRQSVWQELAKIPYGKTASYADIAQAIKNPKAVRAVGTANGANPISIIVPCHRVIGSNGSLTGYAGGLARKEWLLGFEEKKL